MNKIEILAPVGSEETLKAAVLSFVTYLLYKRVSPLLHQKAGR